MQKILRFFLSSISLSILIPLLSLLAFYLFINTPKACFFPGDAWTFLGQVGAYLAGIGTILLVVAGTKTARHWQKEKLYQLFNNFDRQLDQLERKVYFWLDRPIFTGENSEPLYYVNRMYRKFPQREIESENRKLSNIAYSITLFFNKRDTEILISKINKIVTGLDELMNELLGSAEVDKKKAIEKLSEEFKALRAHLDELKKKFL